ncbi:MAG: cytotoxic translational repressor of toxin-antitoxin stability system [Actinobacteria bacterium]|nr:cytotoxic translational repressor of toxin-antitoxin stability system [Actinomycetota bacterium]
MRPLPHSAVRKFVETEGWTQKGTARGRSKTGDHFRYTLTLATGEVLYTRVSHGSGQLDDPKIVAHVLRAELAVSAEDFWACVDNGVLPPRPQPPRHHVPGEVLDAKLARNLIQKVGLTESDLSALSKEEAVRRWNAYLASGEA